MVWSSASLTGKHQGTSTPNPLMATPSNPSTPNTSASNFAPEMNNGWTAVPVSLEEFLSSYNVSESNTKPLAEGDIKKAGDYFPSDPISKKVHEYAVSKLPRQTVNHSIRVYLYGQIIMDQHLLDAFRSQGSEAKQELNQVFFLACMLHDIGTAGEFLKTTRMSFDFKGAIVAMDVLKGLGVDGERVDAVGEAIIRHQDLGDTGSITFLGALLQVVTVLDNVGMFPHLVHKATIEEVCRYAPREEWSGCFAGTIKEEIGAKPWCHSTHIDGFADKVAGNSLMEEYEHFPHGR